MSNQPVDKSIYGKSQVPKANKSISPSLSFSHISHHILYCFKMSTVNIAQIYFKSISMYHVK